MTKPCLFIRACVNISASSHPIYANAGNVCSIYDVITGFVMIGGRN